LPRWFASRSDVSRPVGERVAALEQWQKDAQENIKGLIASIGALNTTLLALNANGRPREGGFRDWRFLLLLGGMAAGGGGTAKIIDAMVKAMTGG
jgi:hypothetical protein